MHGVRTLLVLGAGASFCYEDGHKRIPTQDNIFSSMSLQGDINSPSRGFPTVIGPYGLAHSYPLAEFLRNRFKLPELSGKRHAKMDYWPRLGDLGLNLETLYGLLENELQDSERGLLSDFEAIVRTAVVEPCGDRSIQHVCRYHRQLAVSLEPGDTILTFNWDPLLYDALLKFSTFWFPCGGFGLPDVGWVVNDNQKNYPVNSLVATIPIHGSTCVFEHVSGSAQEERTVPSFIFFGPNTLNAHGSMLTLMKELDGVDILAGDKPTGIHPTEEERKRFSLGWLWYQGEWFKPLFVPPTKNKETVEKRYVTTMRRQLYRSLLNAQQIIVAGYSFPESDGKYLSQLFLPDLLLPNMPIRVVNPDNDKAEYRKKVASVFSGCKLDFSICDFREFSSANNPTLS